MANDQQFKNLSTAPLPYLKGYFRPGADGAMAASTLGVTALQTAAFTLLNIPRLTPEQQNRFKRALEDPQSYQPDEPDGYAANGMPVYGRIILGKANPDGTGGVNRYTDAQDRESFYQTVELDCALVNVEYNNKVVETFIQGLGDSIKEFISTGSRSITITGIFNSTPGVAPMEFINNLNLLFTAQVPIPVTNYMLNQMNVFYVVIMPGSAMWQSEGSYATQAFSIQCVSDLPTTEMLP